MLGRPLEDFSSIDQDTFQSGRLEFKLSKTVKARKLHLVNTNSAGLALNPGEDTSTPPSLRK